MRKIVLIGVAVLAVLIGIGIIAGDKDKGSGPDTPSRGALRAAAATAGCTAVQETTPPKGQVKHVNGEIDYPEIPPNYGDHNARTLRNVKRFYSREDNPAPEQAVHDLEHGLVVAWYDTELPDDQVRMLEENAQDIDSGRFVVVPWNRGAFPGGQHFVLTAWGTTRRCRSASIEVLKGFIEDHADSPKAPEATYPV